MTYTIGKLGPRRFHWAWFWCVNIFWFWVLNFFNAAATICCPYLAKPLSRPGRSQRGCSTNRLVINSLIQWVREPFPPTALRRRHAQTVRDRTSSYKIDYFIVIKNFLNPEGHQNPISGSKVTAILLKGGFCLLGELHREGSAPAACAAGLFLCILNQWLVLHSNYVCQEPITISKFTRG